LDRTIQTAIDEARIDEAGTLVAGFRFDGGEEVFRGHFPGRPLVPGVFFIQMVCEAMRQALNRAVRPIFIHRARFESPLGPDTPAQLTASCQTVDGRMKVEARFESSGVTIAQLTMTVAEIRGPEECHRPSGTPCT
jgi:3-hydroxyacyl-[acyl-carrier-protein] dehydratase